VFTNRVLRGIFGGTRNEIVGGSMIQHNEHFRKLYSSPNIIRAIKPTRIWWTGHVAPMAKEEKCIQDFGGRKGRKEITKKT
jgi:hypothetical protein